MATNRPFEGLADLLVEYQFKKNQMDEQKKQHAESIALEKAKMRVAEDTERRRAMQGVVELTTPQVQGLTQGLSPEEKALMPIDFSKFYTQPGTGEQIYTADRPFMEDWYKNRLAFLRGEAELGRVEETEYLKGKGKAMAEREHPELAKEGRQPTYYDIWKGQQPPGADISMEAYRKAFGSKITKVDYGKALDDAKYEYALRDVDLSQLNRVDLQDMAKEIQTGDMIVTEEAKVVRQIVEAKRKNKKIAINWDGISAKYPDLNIEAIKIALKRLRVKF